MMAARQQPVRFAHVSAHIAFSCPNMQPSPGTARSLREQGAIDLYDVAGVLIRRIDFAGGRSCLAIDLAHLLPQLLAVPCRSVVLRHTHPSGSPEPSEADILTTRAFASLLRQLGIDLHDHVVETGTGHASFRDRGLL